MINRDNTIELQNRDLDLLLGLFECRVMTLAHLVALYFDGRIEAARKRIQRLKATGYLNERPRKVYEAAIFFLTRKSFEALKANHKLDSFPKIGWTALEKRIRVSELTLRHELEVVTLKVALTQAINATSSFHVTEFDTWPALFQFTARRERGYATPDVLIKPDGFLRITELAGAEQFEHTFFVEVDRSTESQDILAFKANCYVDYYKSGRYAERLGQERAAYKDFPFCALFILKTVERRNNTAERLLQLNPPIYRQVWLTTFQECLDNPLGAIWVQPKEYSETVKETPFDPINRSSIKGYRRQIEREKLVEKALKKRSLFSQYYI